MESVVKGLFGETLRNIDAGKGVIAGAVRGCTAHIHIQSVRKILHNPIELIDIEGRSRREIAIFDERYVLYRPQDRHLTPSF